MGRRFLTTLTLPALPSAPSSPSVGDMYFDTTLGKIGVYTASGWVYYLYQIEDESVTTNKIADGAVTSSKLAPGAAVANLGYTPVNKAGDTMSGSLTVPSLLGPNNADLLINGRNYGVEIRIDEDSYGGDTFRITRGSGGSTTLMLVQNTGNVGIGTTSPTQRLDVAGNIRGTQFISTASTGTAPFQVSSTTKVDNLNADLLDGYDTSTSATANTVAVRDNNGYLTASGLLGSNSFGLLINARNLGMELRIDEDNSGDQFLITKGTGGSTPLLTVYNDGSINIGGFDLRLGTSDQSTRGNTGSSRALVKDNNATLAINYAGDFSGGIRIDGPGLGIGGTNYVHNTNTSYQIPGADANARRFIVRDTASGAGVISFNNTKNADGNILGSLVWTREGGQADGHRQVAGIVAIQSGTGATAGSELRFYTKGPAWPIQRMVIDSAGRVGIGVSSPTEKLETDGNVKASRFISTVPTGISPLQVASTTKVTNLNADLLDGYDSTDFARKAENATITGNWTFNGDITIQQGRLITYNPFHRVLYPKWGFSTNQNNSSGKWQKIGTFSFSGVYRKCHIHAIIWGGRDGDDLYSTQHLVMGLDVGNSTNIDTTNYILGLYLEHVFSNSGTANYTIRDARIVIPDPTNAPNVAELWIQWHVNWAAVSPEVHIIGPGGGGGGITVNIETNVTGDANTAPTSPPSTGTVLLPNHSRIADLANKLATARTISLGGSLSGSASFDGSSNITINASINSGSVGTTQIADGAVTAPKLAPGAATKKFQTTIGDGTSSTYTVTHNLNTTDIEVSLILLSTNEKIGAKVEVLNNNQVQVSFISPIATNSVKVIVIG